MQTFIEKVLSEITQKQPINADAIFILPSKRAVAFLKKTLVKQSHAAYFAPKVISIEAFIEDISGLKISDNLTLLLSSFEVYSNTDAFVEKDTFQEFSTWIQPILNDFNEIDRYLIPKKDFFSYLLSIQTLEKWGVKNEKTPFIKNYLSFWKSLEAYYDQLIDALSKKQMGYQGMVYRKAAEDIEHYILANGFKAHYFIGFNALNKAEQTIFQELLETGNTTVFWDMDSRILDDKDHAASHFLRNYLKQWNYYKKIDPVVINSTLEKREITIVDAQNDIGQVKYVAQLISHYSQDIISKTAIVLADEKLLIPLLYSLPDSIKAVNVTMGVPLNSLKEVQFFHAAFDFFLNPSPYYYKKVETLLLHPWAKVLLGNPETMLAYIKEQNITYISHKDLLPFVEEKNEELLAILFHKFSENVGNIVANFQLLIQKIQTSKQLSFFEDLILSKLKGVFNRLEMLHQQYPFIENPLSLKTIYEQIVASETLDFEGNPDQGLQIMGILETRVLDFENVLLLSVNEGTLPSGKTHSSFITHDLKLQFGLPLTPEKDAVYAYHFYHLLFRAKNCTFIYNSHANGLNSGEKSRFLMQLEIEKRKENTLIHYAQASHIIKQNKHPKEVKKTPQILAKLKDIGEQGFSPSALLSYIRNPMDFYFERILGINEAENLEETVAYNTLGTIVHQTLENLYKPFLNSELSVEMLRDCKKRITSEVTQQFKTHYKLGDYSKGKNLIIFEVAKKYVENLINYDSHCLKEGNSIKIIALEEKLKATVTFPEIEFPITLKGTVDRVDLFNNELRIIDYKTGRVEQKELDIIDWELLTEDYKFSKAFQVLMYAYMYRKNVSLEGVQAGIISFKNLQAGYMRFQKKEAPRSHGISVIDSEILLNFETALKELLIKVLNPEHPFTEKEIT
ncbi:MAG: PD-(D/E)XK nuclease family protein [Flavobacteriaceae bacterium]|nr:PD-(D/E)XK nuclease family protein [Flavobacteriaceae bacterium]